MNPTGSPPGPVSWERMSHGIEKVRDLLEIGQIDETWLDRIPPSLRDRLQALIDNPDG